MHACNIKGADRSRSTLLLTYKSQLPDYLYAKNTYHLLSFSNIISEQQSRITRYLSQTPDKKLPLRYEYA